MQTTVPALQQQFPQLLSAEEPACMTEPDGGQSRTNDTNDSGQHPCAVLCVLSTHISCYRAARPMDQPVVLLDYQQPCTANQFDPRELGWGAAGRDIRANISWAVSSDLSTWEVHVHRAQGLGQYMNPCHWKTATTAPSGAWQGLNTHLYTQLHARTELSDLPVLFLLVMRRETEIHHF